MLNKEKVLRENVLKLLQNGIKETEIAEQLHVSRQTIVRPVRFFKQTSQNWFDSLAKDGFIFEHQMALDKVKRNGTRLDALYE